jgi:hypothetical protein
MTNASHVRRKLLVDLVDDLMKIASAHREQGDQVDPTSHERAYQDGAGDALESAARKVKDVLGQDDPDVPDGFTQLIVNLTTNRMGDLYWIADALGLSRTDAVNWALMKARQHVNGEKRSQEILARVLGVDLLEVRRLLGWHTPGLSGMVLADWQLRSPGHNLADSTPPGDGPTGDGDADLAAAAQRVACLEGRHVFGPYDAGVEKCHGCGVTRVPNCRSTAADVDNGLLHCRLPDSHPGEHRYER